MSPGLLVCGGADRPPPIATAYERYCHLCAASVWVSPSMVSYVDSGTYLATCEPCGEGLITQGGMEEAMVHPAQVQELRGLGLLGAAKRHARVVNALYARRRR